MTCKLLIILPAWIGWIMVITFFSKYDQENYKEFGSKIRTDNVYNVHIVPFWLFDFGFPLTNVAFALHVVTGKWIIGVIFRIFGTVCAFFIGCHLYFFSVTFAQYDEDKKYDYYDDSFPYEGYYIVGFIGALLSMLSLVAMMVVMPITKKTNSQLSYVPVRNIQEFP